MEKNKVNSNNIAEWLVDVHNSLVRLVVEKNRMDYDNYQYIHTRLEGAKKCLMLKLEENTEPDTVLRFRDRRYEKLIAWETLLEEGREIDVHSDMEIARDKFIECIEQNQELWEGTFDPGMVEEEKELKERIDRRPFVAKAGIALFKNKGKR